MNRVSTAVLVVALAALSAPDVAFGQEQGLMYGGTPGLNTVEEVFELGYIPRWLICGPFPDGLQDGMVAALTRDDAALTESDFLADHGGEAVIEPRLGLSHRSEVSPDRVAVWQAYGTGTSVIDIGAVHTVPPEAVGYAACYLKSESDLEAFVDLRSFVGASVWLNHEPVHKAGKLPFRDAGSERFLLSFRTGYNILLVKFAGVQVSYLAGLLGRPAEEMRALLEKSRGPVFSATSGVAVSLQVLPVKRVGETGLRVVPRLSSTGTFQGPAGMPTQDVLVTVINGAETELAEFELALVSKRTGREVRKRVPSLGRGHAATVELGLEVQPELAGTQAEVALVVDVAEEHVEIPASVEVYPIPSPDEVVYVVPATDLYRAEPHDQRARVPALVSSVEQHLLIAKADPGYGVHLSGIPYLKPFYDTRPDERDGVREFVAQGRVETGGSYGRLPSAFVGGEAIITNLAYGRLFHEAVFGDKSTVYASLDSRGLCPQMSQLLKKSGYTGALWVDKANGVSPTFWHQSPDGTRLLHTCVPRELASSNPAELRRLLSERLKQQTALGLTVDVRFDAGTSGSPTPWLCGRTAELGEYFPRIKVAGNGATQYFEQAHRQIEEKRLRIPVTSSGEDNRVSGTRLRAPELRHANRLAENALLNAARFSAMANMLGARYPEKALDKAWRQLLFGQDQGALTGTFDETSYVDLVSGYREALNLANECLRNAIRFVGSKVNTRERGPRDKSDMQAIVVCNPMSWERTDYVEVDVEFEPGASGVSLYDEGGKTVPVELLSAELDGAGAIRAARILFVANDVPPVGYKTYYVRPTGSKPETARTSAVSIENEFYRVTVDPQRGGGVVNIVDKTTGKEFVPDGEAPANELIFLSQGGAGTATAVDVKPESKTTFSRSSPATVVAETGPVASRLIVTGKMPTCERTQRITLYKGVKRIDCVTSLAKHTGEDELCVVTFPTDLGAVVPVFEDRFSAVVAPRSDGLGAFSTVLEGADSGVGVRPSYQWFGLSSSGHIELGDVASVAIGPVGMIVPRDEAVGSVAAQLRVSLTKKGIPSATFYDVASGNGVITAGTGEGTVYGGLFRFSLGDVQKNRYTQRLLAEAAETARGAFEQRLESLGYAYLFVLDSAEPGPPVPVLIVAARTSNALQKAVDELIGDFEPDAVISLPVEDHAAGPGLTVPDHGLAIANKGSVVNSVDVDNTMVLALMRCSAAASRSKADTHVFSYALYPHEGNWRDARAYRFGYEFNNPLVAVTEPLHDGILPHELAFLRVTPDNAVVTQVKPKGFHTAAFKGGEPSTSDGLIVRLYEATGFPADAKIEFMRPLLEAWETDMLENRGEKVRLVNSQIAARVSPFSIETFELKPKVSPVKPETALAGEMEVSQPVFTRFWKENAGAAPLGYGPVGVFVSRQLSPGDVSVGEVRVTITNDYADRVVSGTATVIVPEGWRAVPSEFSYDVPVGGHLSRDVVIAFLHGASEKGIVKARIEHDGQTYQDVLEVGENRLEVTIERVAPDTVRIAVANPNAQAIEGRIELITPIETWPASEVGEFSMSEVSPVRHGIVVPGRGEVVEEFSAASEMSWAVVKLSYNGHVQYIPINGS